MMKVVDPLTNIFDEGSFLEDEVVFNLMHRIHDDPKAIIMASEDEKVIIAQSSENHPAWIWVDKAIGQTRDEEIADAFLQVFAERTQLKFVATPYMASFLAKDFAKRKDITWKKTMSMEAYHCPEIIEPKGVSGTIGKPCLEDAPLIATFFAGFIKDCFDIDVKAEQQLETAKSYIQSEDFYVWKNEGEIVSMAFIAHRSKRHGRINEVYTPVEHREKGYAGALVAALCNLIQSENRTPVLYTDLSNPASNRAYKKIGFLECGKVDQVEFEFPKV